MHKSIDKVLAALMDGAHLSQTELSKATGVGQGTISRILNPSGPKGIKSPTDKQVRPLAEFFHVSTDQLRGHEPLTHAADKVLMASEKVAQPLAREERVQMQARDLSEIKTLPLTGSELFLGTGEARNSNVEETLQPYRTERKYPLISDIAAGTWMESCDNFHPGTADEWLSSDKNAGTHGYWLLVKGRSMEPHFMNGDRILVQPEGFDLINGKYYVAKLLDSGDTTFKQYIKDAGVAYLQPLNNTFPLIQVTDNVSIIGRVIDKRLDPSFF